MTKLEANERWRTRLILPEHREEVTVSYDYRGKRPKIDEQQWDEIMRVLMESFGMQTIAKFLLYDPYEECAAIGVVERVDAYTRTFIVDGERFKIADVIGATVM